MSKLADAVTFAINELRVTAFQIEEYLRMEREKDGSYSVDTIEASVDDLEAWRDRCRVAADELEGSWDT